MSILFYAAALISIIAGVLVVTRRNAMHALISLVLVFLAIAVMLFSLGSPFVAALQVIIYAGAIMVLFVFSVMMLNLGSLQEKREKEWLAGGIWIAPLLLAAVLLGLVGYALAGGGPVIQGEPVWPYQVGVSLFQRYIIGVELASMLLLAGLVSAFHFGVFLRGWGSEGDGDRSA